MAAASLASALPCPAALCESLPPSMVTSRSAMMPPLAALRPPRSGRLPHGERPLGNRPLAGPAFPPALFSHCLERSACGHHPPGATAFAHLALTATQVYGRTQGLALIGFCVAHAAAIGAAMLRSCPRQPWTTQRWSRPRWGSSSAQALVQQALPRAAWTCFACTSSAARRAE